MVYCYFAVDCYYACEIVAKMSCLGASGRHLADAWSSMCDGKLNGGITYSNPRRRESVMVTELTTSAREFMNSFVHETGHLATHIALEDDIPLDGEEVRYLQGEIAWALFPTYRTLLCDMCRAHTQKK